jgi:SAM-dependent methyltransferase
VSVAPYDRLGQGYSRVRQADPRIAAQIDAALGDARTVLNVGAGTGSYEPRDRHVIAIEPSDVMAAQRPAGLAPAIRATAGSLPLRDASVDAAMAILTVHHWDAELERGVRELRRVTRDTIVILTFDAEASSRMWLVADYLPELAELDRRIFPTIDRLTDWLGCPRARVETVEVTRDTPDWTFAAFWAHPERVLDPAARASTSGLARMHPAVIERLVTRVGDDLESGAWDARHGDLRRLDAYDAGLRLVVAG